MPIKKADALKLVHRMMQAASERDFMWNSDLPMHQEFLAAIGGHVVYSNNYEPAISTLMRKHGDDPITLQAMLMRHFIGVCDDL